MNGVADWNGTSWSALTSGLHGARVAFTLAQFHDSRDPFTHAITHYGELVVGGQFDMAGDKCVQNFSRWTDDGLPQIVIQPMMGACPDGNGDVHVSVIVAPGYDLGGPLGFQWYNANGAIMDGLHGATPITGGTVSGATTDSLTIAGFDPTDAGAYFVRVTNFSCGHVDSTLAFLGMLCPADFNGSCSLEVQDIFDFLNAWLAVDPRADFNGVNGITTQDIFDFLNAWLAGCS